MSATKKEPKFKVGDRVRVIGSPSDLSMSVRPDIGTVIDVCRGSWRQVQFDDWSGGWGDKNSMWGLDVDDLELASLAAKFYVVLYPGDGKPSYDTKAIAEERAAKLASDYPGDGYAVLRIESVTTASAPPVTVERF